MDNQIVNKLDLIIQYLYHIDITIKMISVVVNDDFTVDQKAKLLNILTTESENNFNS